MEKQCEARFMAHLDGFLSIPLAQCDRKAGHRPQTWHRSVHPNGGTVDWSFTDEERAEWKRLKGEASDV